MVLGGVSGDALFNGFNMLVCATLAAGCDCLRSVVLMKFSVSCRQSLLFLVSSNAARYHTIRYDTIGEFNVDWKAEYSALSSTRSQKKKLKQTTPVPL